jgi:NTP pyrophosphatase (non-canonical NTP hydrolase)
MAVVRPSLQHVGYRNPRTGVLHERKFDLTPGSDWEELYVGSLAGVVYLDGYQSAAAEFQQRHFGEHADTFHSGLLLAEEAGEVCRAILKRMQGIRGTRDEWTAMVRKECIDVQLVLLGIAHYEGFSLAGALSEFWPQIEARDVNHDPIGGPG